MDDSACPQALLPWPGSLSITLGPLKQGHCCFSVLSTASLHERQTIRGKGDSSFEIYCSRKYVSVYGASHLNRDNLPSWKGQPTNGRTLFALLSRESQLIPLSAHGFFLLPNYSLPPAIPHSSAFIFLILTISFASAPLSSSFINKHTYCISLLHKSQLQTSQDACHDILFQSPDYTRSLSLQTRAILLSFLPWCNAKGQLPSRVINGNYYNNKLKENYFATQWNI